MDWHLHSQLPLLNCLDFGTPKNPVQSTLNKKNPELLERVAVQTPCSITYIVLLFFLGQSKEVVELVSLFPTIAELAGLQVPPACPEMSFGVVLCTEGTSIVHYFNVSGRMVEEGKEGCDGTDRCFKEEPFAFSQYPRPADTPQWNSDKPKLKDIRIMGYSMRTIDYRYTVWVQFDPNNFSANFEDVHAGELYMMENDPNQDYNIYYNTSHGQFFKKILDFLKH